MTQATDAADVVRRLAKQYEGMKFAADVLERFGSLEQATDEAEKARAVAENARDAALAALELARNDLSGVQERAQSILDQATERGEEMIRVANESAAKVIGTANERAAAVMRDANVQAQSINDEALRAKAAATMEVNAAHEAVAVLTDQVAAMRDEADAIERRVAQAKAEAKKILGGE